MKIAIVTGASSGMGRDFVKQISVMYAGMDEIWVIARREERLRELESQVDIKLRCLPLDLTDNECIKTFKDLLEKENPQIKLIVNSSGFGKIGRFSDLDFSDNIGMVTLNCVSLTAITYIALKYMANGSQIISLASSAAFMPQPKFAVYAATKSYVLSFSRALSCELRPLGISVTAVCPGPVKTEFFDIAETTGKIPLYKHLSMAVSQEVVRGSLKSAKKGRAVYTHGLMMKTFRVLCKILPRSLMMKTI